MTGAEARFLRFTEPYTAYGDKIRIKIDHTLRVRDLCADVAKSIGLGGDDVELASICGLLHDIGRFEQWRIYGTYNDSRSVDHGDLGAEFLREHDRIRIFAETDHDTILHAVEYHNKYRLPDTLSDRDRRFADITRDADKLDILYSFAVGELTCRSRNTAMSEAVFRTVMDGRGIQNRELATKADEIAVRLAFVFDLRFRRSFEILRKSDSIGRMIRLQREEAENEVLKRQLDVLSEHIQRYLEEQAGV